MWRIGSDPARMLQDVGAAGVQPDLKTSTRTPVEIKSDAPVGHITRKQKPTTMGAMFGFMKPVVAAALIGASIVTPAYAQQANGVPLDAEHQIIINPPYSERVLPTETSRTRGAIVMEQLTLDIERLMRVTARDMANPNTRFIDGMPGFKEPDPAEVRRAIERALKEIPLGELPGGRQLAQLVRQLPNAGHLDAENMTIRELERALGDAGKKWLDEHVKPLIDGHELEISLAAFAAVTAARAASPDAAGVLDQITPPITLWRLQSDDNNSNVRVRARYRNEEILPNIDVTARTQRFYGPWMLSGQLEAQLSAENSQHVIGTATATASYNNNGRFMTADATYYHDGKQRFSVIAGVINPDRIAYANLTGFYGDGVALGDAPGRVSFELDYDRRFSLGNGTQGTVGAYLGTSMDSDGSNRDVRGGFVVRLTW